MSHNNYWVNKFHNLVDMLSDKFGIEINLFPEIPKHLYVDDEDLPYNGTAFLDEEEGQHMIDLYGNLDKFPSELICVLIHEFGHILAYTAFGKDHSESDAWLMGKAYIKDEFIPPNFDNIMNECLETYQ